MTKRGQSDHEAHLAHELHVHQVELEMQNEELRRTRDEVEAALQRFTQIFALAPVGYLVLDKRGAILEGNLEFARLVGVPHEALEEWTLPAFVATEQRQALADFLHRCLMDALPRGAELEVVLHRKDAEPATVRLLASMLAGPEPSVLVAVRDISASKRAETAREEIAHKDEFMAALSHELRNPLSPISNSLGLLERTEVATSAPPRRKAMTTMRRQLRHLERIIDDLLDATRIAHGKVRLQRERLELAALVEQVIEDHRPAFEAKGVTLAGQLEDRSLEVDADRTRIVQVVGNLLVNASKFTPTGGCVQVGLRREGSEAILWVRDNGAGINADVRERLFAPFAQAPQTLDRSRGGLGLGLALVKGLVELHGGTVAVASEGPGKGSEFVVRLPLVEGPVEQRRCSAPGPCRAPRRVLVVDDNADAADSLRELLEVDAHQVRVAHDGPTALLVARDFRPEVVFCDIGLPGLDGYDVARSMRSEPDLAGTYLVALSGYARPEDREKSAQAGFDCHLAKPPSSEALESALAR